MTNITLTALNNECQIFFEYYLDNQKHIAKNLTISFYLYVYAVTGVCLTTS